VGGVYQLATGLGRLESEESKHSNTETNRRQTTLHNLLLLSWSDQTVDGSNRNRFLNGTSVGLECDRRPPDG